MKVRITHNPYSLITNTKDKEFTAHYDLVVGSYCITSEELKKQGVEVDTNLSPVWWFNHDSILEVSLAYRLIRRLFLPLLIGLLLISFVISSK